MELVGNFIGQIFCIGLMLALISGVIGGIMQKENQALFRVIGANILYSITQFFRVCYSKIPPQLSAAVAEFIVS